MAQEDTSSALIWFAAGALLGAVVALLVAPDSGEDTRRKLAKQAKRSRKAVADSGQDIIDRGRELYERGRDIAEEAAELFERGRRVAEKTINDVI